MSDDAKSFWTSLPGVLTGLAAVVTAVTGLFVAVNGGLAKPPHEDVVAVAQGPAHKPAPTPLAPTADAEAAASDAGIYSLSAVIDTPDGFINVRAGRGSKTESVAVIKTDEQFYTYKQDAKWWKVKTRDGVVGYVHISRIHLLDTPPTGN